MSGFDFVKSNYYCRQHHKRWKHRVAMYNLTCQECGGDGGEINPVLDYGAGPWEECGWCEGIGFVDPHRRGEWLRMKRAQKQETVQ